MNLLENIIPAISTFLNVIICNYFNDVTVFQMETFSFLTTLKSNSK
jgi:hypothetical protein